MDTTRPLGGDSSASPGDAAAELAARGTVAVLVRYHERWGTVRGAQSALVTHLFTDCARAMREGRAPAAWTTEKLRRIVGETANRSVSEGTFKKEVACFAKRLRALHESGATEGIVVSIDGAYYTVRVAGPRPVDRQDGRAGVFLSISVPRPCGSIPMQTLAPTVTHHFPAAVPAYVPDEESLAPIMEAVRRHGCVRIGIAGLPGTGKTELAKDLARRLAEAMGGAAVFVRIGDRGEDVNWQEIAAQCGRTSWSPPPAPCVLVLDDVRAVSVLQQIEFEACIVIVTGRETLPIPGCRWFQQRGVSRHVGREILRRTSLRTDIEDPAGSFFLRDNPIIGPTAGDHICYFSGWMPRAIADAGAYLAANPQLSAVDHELELEDQWIEPSRPSWRIVTPVEALVQQSLSELDQASRRLYTRLGVFGGWMTASMAGAVLEGMQIPQRFVTRGLLEYDRTTAAYRIPYFARVLIEEALEDDPEESRSAKRLWAWRLGSWAEDLLKRKSHRAREELSVMREDIVSALLWAMRQPRVNDDAVGQAILWLSDLMLPGKLPPSMQLTSASDLPVVAEAFQDRTLTRRNPRYAKDLRQKAVLFANRITRTAAR